MFVSKWVRLPVVAARRNVRLLSSEVPPTEEAKPAPPAASATQQSALEQISQMSVSEFEQLLNSVPKPTLNRDEVVLRKFQKLFKTYMNRDQLRKDFTSSSALLSQFPNLVPTGRAESYSKAELALRQKHHAQVMGSLGSEIKNVYRPHELVSKPSKASKVTAAKLMASGAHLGHAVSLWNNKTQPFIYGEYKGIHIIDMDKTVNYLRRAASVVEGVAENGGLILFLGLREGQLKSVKEAARRCNGYYVARHWVPGTITNSLENPAARFEVDMADTLTGRTLEQAEKEQVLKPDLMVILSPLEAKVAVKEANQLRVPTIGIVDTNCDPEMVTYAIPANDDSIRATNLICGVLARAAEAGYKRRLGAAALYKKKLGVAGEEPIPEMTDEE